MIQAALFDPDNAAAEKIAGFEFWNRMKDIVYIGRQDISELEQGLAEGRIGAVLAVADFRAFVHTDFLHKIISNYTEVSVIIISRNDSYKSVRKAFLLGVSDYLLFDNLEKALEKSVISLFARKLESYFSDKIYDKIKVLASHIFNGGEQVMKFVDDIVECVYSDWNGDEVVCQQVIERIKLESYKLFVLTKPWLEKFIYRGDYVLGIGFEFKTKDEIKAQLYNYYSDIGKLFKKYNVIDVNKTIYTIGKSVINNIDKRVSLDFVAEDVYLNKTYISHIFKKMTGISFNEFLLDVKIERSKILLHYPNLSLSEIADMLNFCNSSYFGVTFKKYTGMTPSEYKAYIKGNA